MSQELNVAADVVSIEELRAALEKEQRVAEKERAAAEKEKAALEKLKAATEKAKEAAAQEKEQVKQDRAQLHAERGQLQAEKARIEQERRTLETQKKAAAERDRSLTEREVNAENEFAVQNEKTLGQLKTQIPKLQEEIEKQRNALAAVHRDYDKVKAAKEAELDRWAEEYKALKMKSVEAEVSALQKDATAKIELLRKAYEHGVKLREQEFEAIRKEFDLRLAGLQEARKEQLNLKQELEERQADLETRLFEIRLERRLLDEKESALNATIKAQVEERVREMAAALRDKTRAEEEWIRKLNAAQQELDAHKQADMAARGRSKEDLLQEIDRLEQDNKMLERELRSRPDAAVIAVLEQKVQQYEELRRQNRELIDIKTKLEHEKNSWAMSVSELERQKEQRLIQERRLEAIQTLAQKYEDDVKRLKSQFDQPKAVEERVRVIELPPQGFEKDVRMRDNASEMEWLGEIYAKCQESGLYFNERLLYSFHTALKTSEWSPLTILAGVSGTGKSKLPELYSRFGGLYCLPLAVQPDWDSPQSLFGYFNSIDNNYNATTLLRAMVQFQDSKDSAAIGGLSDRMLLVLLDEMNLAHVELYFSDMLSKLESRRGNPLAPYIDIDIGAGHDKYQVQLSRNMLWVGTMNEDETTKSLSDKVLDRGNLINFPRPVTFESRHQPKQAAAGPMLRKDNWNRWVNHKFTFTNEMEPYKLGLEAINERLEHVGRALGHRVWQSVENYVANHPLVIRAAEEDNADGLTRHIASSFEEAVVHKVMPKLRGIDSTDGNSRAKCLDPIGDILANIAPGLVTDYQIAKDPNFGFFMWKSAKYLEQVHASR
jgi:hypothetical protein